MKMVFQQKVQEKEAKLKQSEEELYARHREMKEALEKQRGDLEEKKRRIESGRPLTPDNKNNVGFLLATVACTLLTSVSRLAERRASSVPRHDAIPASPCFLLDFVVYFLFDRFCLLRLVLPG